MPPKAKYSKQEIIEKAVEIISTEGINKLTARELGAALGTSVRPIFTAFENMEEVKQECFKFAFEKYHSYFADGLGEQPFKTIGRIYIKFAKEEPKLFQVIFMESQAKAISFPEYMKKLDDNYEDTISLVQKEFELDEVSAEKFYRHLWIYATGIAVLCATNQCMFSDEEIEEMLDDSCKGFLKSIGREK